MFVWWSSGESRPRVGCGGGLIFLPFAFFSLSAGTGSDAFWLLLLGVTVIAALLFLVPRFLNTPAAQEKRKNDRRYDDEKPKRTPDRFVLTDDGEILDMTDDDRPRADQHDA